MRNFKQVRNFIQTDISIYIATGILSAVIFCLIYGVKILNPMYTDWLMAGGDLSCHYLGWRAYRISEWHFPIGMIDSLAYPNLTSIIFTDSIPLFALIFKVLSPILPAKFQYFGLWGILCFMLQGILAARIIKKYSQSKALTVLTSLLFTVAPIMIFRMFAHTALADQWIILFGLGLIFLKEKYENSKTLYITVGVLGFLSASVHIYYVVISGLILGGFIVYDFLEQKNPGRILIVLIVYLLSAAATIFLFGGFCSGMTATNGGLGNYSFNLNGLLNPMGWSTLLKDHCLYTEGQYEGFAYLGAGWIIMVILAAVFCINKRDMKRIFLNNYRVLIALSIVSLLSTIAAASNVVSFGEHLIWEMKLPDFVTKVWSVFRASGRFIWTVNYIIMLVSVIIFMKCADKRTVFIVCVILLFLQCWDIRLVLAQTNERFGTVVQYDSKLKQKEFWNALAKNTEIKHVVYYSSVDQPLMYSFTDWALDNGKTVNSFYFARSIDNLISQNREIALAELPEDTVFVFRKDEINNCLNYDLFYYEVDGVIIGYVKELPEMSGFRWD